MSSEGISGIAHRTWVAVDGDEVDMVLLHFATSEGANLRYLGVTASWAKDTTLQTMSTPPGTLGYYRPNVDDQGLIRGLLDGLSGNYMIEEFYFSPTTLRPTDAVDWLSGQLALLK